jgi:hypothetical protein
MELILLALVLTVFLALVPVRRQSPALSQPPAVLRHVDIDEIRNPSSAARTRECATDTRSDEPPRTARRTVPTIEEDHVETLVYGNRRMMAIARGDVLLLRTDD